MFPRHTRSRLYALDERTGVTDSVPGRDINRLRIGFDASTVSITFFQALREFGTNNPSLELGLVEGDPETLLELLRTGTLDLALTTGTVLNVPADMALFTLPRRQLSILIPTDHSLAKAMQVDLALMNNDPIIVYDDHSRYSNRELALNACRRAGFKPPIVIETNSYTAMAAMVATGRGYAICPDDPNLLGFRSAITMIPLLQSWDTAGTLAVLLRASDCPYRDEFLLCFTSKHRSR
jgi:DNA-binding transcriptional LysR family regulator